MAPARDGEDNREKGYVRGRKRRRSFGSSLQDSSFDERLWATSQETIPDTDIDDSDDELDSCDDSAESQSKIWCVESPCNHNCLPTAPFPGSPIRGLLLRCSRAISIDVLYRMFHVVQYEKASVLFELNSAATCRDFGEQARWAR